ncbi:MAG: hypothetical protein ACT4PM_12715 [Gemmatimonadales bacterium]
MKIPWMVYAESVSQAFPLFVGLTRLSRLTPPRRWILAWCALPLASSALTLLLALQNRNNHWVGYVATPIEYAMVLWVLSYWQRTAVAFLAFRLLIPFFGLTWVGIVLALENPRTFSLLAEPFGGLLLLAGAVYTLLSNALRESDRLVRQDWAWVGAGICLFAGSAIALPPAAHILLSRSPELVVRAYEVKAVFRIVAFLAIAWGVMCPILAWRSGGFSSRASSRWRSYSLASSRRW